MEIHQQKVYDCIQAIIQEVRSIDLYNCSQKYKAYVIDRIISKMAKKFDLNYKNIKTIYLGKLKYN